MRTKHIEYLLPEYVDGTIANSLRAVVEHHLKSCASCSAGLLDLRQTMAMLRIQKAAKPPSGYFGTVLPNVRVRMERNDWRTFFTNPLLIRLALPIGAAAVAIAIFLSFPFPGNDLEATHNPLTAVMHGSSTGEVMDVVFDMVPLQPLSSPTVEGETSSLLGMKVLRSDHLLANADDVLTPQDPSLDGTMPEGLDQLSDTDLEALVQRLGERTTL